MFLWPKSFLFFLSSEIIEETINFEVIDSSFRDISSATKMPQIRHELCPLFEFFLKNCGNEGTKHSFSFRRWNKIFHVQFWRFLEKLKLRSFIIRYEDA